MIQEGKTYVPIKVEYKKVRGKTYTQFTLPQHHREWGKMKDDGYLNVLVKEVLPWSKGDIVKIKHIKGAQLRLFHDRYYFSLYADVQVKTVADQAAEKNRELLDDNIPDDL